MILKNCFNEKKEYQNEHVKSKKINIFSIRRIPLK